MSSLEIFSGNCNRLQHSYYTKNPKTVQFGHLGLYLFK